MVKSNKLLEELIEETYLPVKDNKSNNDKNKTEFTETDKSDVCIENPYLTFPYFCMNQILFLFQYHPFPNTKKKEFKFEIIGKYKAFKNKYKFYKNGTLEIYSPLYFSKNNGFYFPIQKLGTIGAMLIFIEHPTIKLISVKDTDEKYFRDSLFIKHNYNAAKFRIIEFLNSGLPLVCPNKLLYCNYSKSYCSEKCPYFNFCPI